MVGKSSSPLEIILRFAADGSIKIYPDPPEYRSSSKALAQHKDRVSPVIVLITSITAALLPIGSKQVAAPVTISGGIPRGFVVCIMFAFSCALSAMFLYRKTQRAMIFRLSAIVWFSSAFLVLIYSLLRHRLS